jgi:hypothetical protein
MSTAAVGGGQDGNGNGGCDSSHHSPQGGKYNCST